MNKLTISDVCKYPNSKIEYFGNIYQIGAISPHRQSMFLIDIKDGCQIFVPVSDCKLVLRDIEDMTYDELKQTKIELYGYYYFGDYEEIKKNELSHITYYRVKDYLRSISVDADDFIKLGKAVKQK